MTHGLLAFRPEALRRGPGWMVYLCISMIDKGLHTVKYKGRLILGVEDGFFHLKRGRKGERTAKLNNAQSASFCPATSTLYFKLNLKKTFF